MRLMIVPALILAAALAGCASVPMGDPAQDAALKTFSAKPETAGVYIYRNESFGAAVSMEVDVNGKPIGKTGANTYLYTEVSPGKHTITSKAENSDSIEIVADQGKLYYIWQEVKMGLMSARSKLHLVDEAKGQQGVLQTQLAVEAAEAK